MIETALDVSELELLQSNLMNPQQVLEEHFLFHVHYIRQMVFKQNRVHRSELQVFVFKDREFAASQFFMK